MPNPVCYFEIPVTDMDRAIAFYSHVFGVTFKRRCVDGYEMAFFPQSDGQRGANGALAKGDAYTPSHRGCVIYFDVEDIDETLRQSKTAGAAILYPKKDIGEGGFVAEIEDSEGNRIALNQLNP